MLWGLRVAAARRLEDVEARERAYAAAAAALAQREAALAQECAALEQAQAALLREQARVAAESQVHYRSSIMPPHSHQHPRCVCPMRECQLLPSCLVGMHAALRKLA